MKIVTAAAMTCISLSFCGCGNLLRVSKLNSTQPQGIPFYIRTGACVQETTYALRYYRLTLKISNAAGILSSDTIDISYVAHASADFNALMAQLDQPIPNSGSVLGAWTLIRQRQTIDPYLMTNGLLTLSNTSTPTSVVDYGTTYTINQRKPFSGTASADYKLASDGTLTEAQGQIDDNTFATILSALPIADLVKSAAGIASKAAPAAAGEIEPVKFQLFQEQRYVKTVLSQTSDYAKNCPVRAPLLLGVPNVATAVTDIGANMMDVAPADKEGDSIALSGTIKLPKSLLPSPSTQSAATSQTTKSAADQGGSTTSAANEADAKSTKSKKKKP